MRSKEDAKDYRYFPDPDLPPIHISDAWIEELRDFTVRNFVKTKQLRYQSEYELPAYDAGILTESRHLSMTCLRKVAKLLRQPEKSSKLVYGRSSPSDQGQGLWMWKKFPLHRSIWLTCIQMVEKKEVSAQNAKKVFEKVFRRGY